MCGYVVTEHVHSVFRIRGWGVPSSVPGQSDGKRGAGWSVGRIGIGLDGDVTTVHLDDPIGDAQAEPGSLSRLFGREERLKNLLQGLFLDAGARIAHTQIRTQSSSPQQRTTTRPGRRGGSQRVVNQVGDHLCDLFLVDIDSRVFDRVLHRSAQFPRAHGSGATTCWTSWTMSAGYFTTRFCRAKWSRPPTMCLQRSACSTIIWISSYF